MEAEITLTYEDEREAEAIARAVSPDNIEAPKGLFIETRAVGKSVKTYIKYSGGRVETFQSTIDDLLSCISTAEKTVSTVGKLNEVD